MSTTMRPSTQQRGRPLMATAAIPTILLSVATLIQPALANPFPKDDLHDTLGNGFLQDPTCATYCGLENEYCCSEGETCTTSDNIAGCAAQPTLAPREPQAGGVWSVYTTTWTETDTFTSTISNYWAASTAAGGGGGGADCVPAAGSGEIACGTICCASWQYCAYDGQCLSNPGATASEEATTAWTTYATTMTTAGSTITTQFSAPYRVTGTGSARTDTATAQSATATSSGNGTVAATTGGSSLSGGAIAGIVVGTLAGVALLMALCFCCVMRGLWHGLLALLGLGPKKRERSRERERETVIIEEERYRRGSNHGHRDTHTSWFAGRPARSTAAESRRTSEKPPPKRESDQATWAGAGALGTLLLLLGLRRDKKRRSQSAAAAAKRNSRRSARSEVSSSYFPDSYTASSPSEFSSDYTYSSVYTPAPAPAPARSSSQNPRGARAASVARSQSVRSASRYRDDDRGDYDYIVVEEDPHDARHYDHPPKSNLPPDYAGSASSGGRTRDTRDTRHSRRTETTRISRGPPRR